MTSILYKRQPCVAFADMEGGQWTAGAHYLKNLFLALRMLEREKQPEIALLVAEGSKSENLTSLAPNIDRVLYRPQARPLPGFWQRQHQRVAKRLGTWQEPEPPLASYLRKQGVDCLFSIGDSGVLSPYAGIHLLSWIPDFQHLHLPEMFSSAEIQAINERFACAVVHADRVILSSQHARADFEHFAPQAAHKARVLSFVAQVPVGAYDADSRWMCTHYHLPERFVYLPNQFWKHKNHTVVVQALALLKERHPQVTVVCTGNTNEHRHPTYLGQLLAEIACLGLRENLIILGLVPHEHIFQLIRQSLAVLQPSLFEGWSTTVEEVKAIGKRIILSDIPVHREQAPPLATFFDPHTPVALADCLANAFEEGIPGPDAKLESQARADLLRRTVVFGQTFATIVQEVITAGR